MQCSVQSLHINELNNLFQPDTTEGSALRKFQLLFQKIFTFPPVLFNGRGLFQYSHGAMPHRKERERGIKALVAGSDAPWSSHTFMSDIQVFQ
jgi:hypothetical protein